MRTLTVVIAIIAALLIVSAPCSAWKFAVMGDTQGTGGSDTINVAVMTDIVNRINGEGVSFVLQHGDACWGYCDDACLSSQMDTWLSTMNTLNCPWYYCPGNHEIGDRSTTENVLRGKVNQPLNGPAGHEEMVYSFDYDNAHIVALNSDHYGEQHKVQRSWLTGNLAGTNKPHVFVMAHEPAYPRGPNVGASLDYYPSERDDFWRIMSDDNVGMYFCGHEHFFARQLTNGVYQINNGTSGAPLYTGYQGTIEDYHYVVVDINDLNVSCQVRNRYGALLDSWSYTAPAAQIPYSGVIPVPGLIQAENYDAGADGVSYHDTSTANEGGQYRSDGVDVETCSEGGYNIGWIGAYEWQEYSISVPSSGDYSLKLRVASPSGGGYFHIQIDGTDITGVRSFASTGGWQTYTTLTIPTRYLNAGQHTLRVSVDGGGWNLNYIDVASCGGDAVSTDLASTDINDQITPMQGGDGDTAGATIGGHNCRKNAVTGNDYYMYFSVSSLYAWQGNKPNATITFDYYDSGSGNFSVDYDAISTPYKSAGSVTVTNTNTWKTCTFTVTDAYFGNRQNNSSDLRIVGPWGATFYVDTLTVQASAAGGGQTPYAGVIALPGTIQAENFDNGGEGVAYHDDSAGNTGGEYRSTDVDIRTTTDTGGGYNVGWIGTGEWLEYTVSVASTGDYDFYVRVASGSGGSFKILIDGNDISGTRSFANTGGGQNFTTLVVPARYMTAGQHILQFNVVAGGFDFNKIDVYSRNTDAVSIDMGNPDINDGITHIQVGDGDTVPWTSAGHNCRENVWYDDLYMYFSVSSAWAWQGSKPNVYITFDYYDLGTGQLGIDYDSTSSPYKHVNGPTLTNTGGWKQYTFHVTDAYFGNRQNGGSDFRFTAGAYEWGIDTVTVYQ